MNSSAARLTVDEFLDVRFDLPESGQWSELDAGRLVHLQPPDLDHGNTVLNLSKILAEYASHAVGYPCFDLGLILQRDPDSVLFPPVCYFTAGPRFAETDSVVTETTPTVVIELGSTADRREVMPSRVKRYLEWGVETVWVITPSERSLQVVCSVESDLPARLEEEGRLQFCPGLEGLELKVSDLFTQPSWWSQQTL